MRLPTEWRGPMAEGRLVVVSPFRSEERRATAANGERRNRFVAELAATVLIVHAAPGGKTERLVRELIAAGQPVLTLNDPDNEHLICIGARPVTVEEASRWEQADPVPEDIAR